MKDRVFKRRALVLITAGVAALLVGSLIVGSFVVHHLQHPTGATETSGCATPLAPRENMLYVLAQGPQGSVYISAVDTNGRQHWVQQFVNFTPTRAPLEVRNGIIYALATSFVGQSPINIVAAYDANSGKKLWGIQVPNAHVQPPASDIIVGMSICNTMMYLWTMHDLSAYNVKIYAYNAKNGSLLWQDKWHPLRTAIAPHVEVTDTAIVFASSYPAKNAQGTTFDENAINALNPKNGVPLWKMNIPNSPPQRSSFAAQGLSFTATERAVYIDVLNPGSPQKIAALSISTGKQLWNTSVGKPMADDFRFPSAVVGDNVLYVSTSNYGVVSLNANDGRYLWQDHTIAVLKPLQDKL